MTQTEIKSAHGEAGPYGELDNGYRSELDEPQLVEATVDDIAELGLEQVDWEGKESPHINKAFREYWERQHALMEHRNAADEKIEDSKINAIEQKLAYLMQTINLVYQQGDTPEWTRQLLERATHYVDHMAIEVPIEAFDVDPARKVVVKHCGGGQFLIEER